MSSNTAAVSSGKPSSNTKVSTSTVTGRPTLKNLTRARVPRAGLIGVVFATTGALSWKFLISDKHKRSIASFYKTYDPERDYARMKSAGVFKCFEGRERPEWLHEYESELDTAIASLSRTAIKK